jgi:hypothetical protein
MYRGGEARPAVSGSRSRSHSILNLELLLVEQKVHQAPEVCLGLEQVLKRQ